MLAQAQQEGERNTQIHACEHSFVHAVRLYKIRCQDNGQTELSISVFMLHAEEAATAVTVHSSNVHDFSVPFAE